MNLKTNDEFNRSYKFIEKLQIENDKYEKCLQIAHA